MKQITIFLCGTIIGFLPFAWQNFSSPFQATYEEHVIAQRLYHELNRYTGSYRLECVLDSLHALRSKQRPLLPKKEVYESACNISLQQLDKTVPQRLTQAADFLKTIAQKEGAISIIDDYLYAEILEQGTGEIISQNDTVLIHFKEYLPDGSLIKDTSSDYPFKIPLSQTIRGFKQGLSKAQIGEKRKLYIHPDWGFGNFSQKGSCDVLIYEVTLLDKT